MYGVGLVYVDEGGMGHLPRFQICALLGVSLYALRHLGVA